MRRLLTLILLVLLASPAWSATEVKGVRLWTAPDHTRLVFDTSAAVQHRIFSLTKPHRLVIDLDQTRMTAKPSAESLRDRFIDNLRWAQRDQGRLRVVLDLKQPIRPKSFVLKPGGGYGYRLVVDLHQATVSKKPRVVKSTADIAKARDVIIAIDAGHGGEDPGAMGKKHRTREKQVTLAIARSLKALVDAEPGMRAVLTRTGDYYVRLRKRMEIARKHRADLFVSIHADSFKDARARGTSVYVLSRRGASSEAARWLAERENSADLVGGVSLEDKDHVLASVLLDLSQSATTQASNQAADRVYKQLRGLGKTHGHRVQRANFVVLKSPDIPSMLVETGFISNPGEESKLRTKVYQLKLAKAVHKGIKAYFTNAPPPGTWLAMRKTPSEREHVIRSGDTLTEIASKYQVSLFALRRSNHLNDDGIRVGQVLRIPEG